MITKTNDLTIGKPIRVLSLYALPMLVNMLFQQAYNLVDGWIAGNYLGSVALSAVGTSYPITVLLIAIAAGLSNGTSIHCSQTYGAKDYEKVKSCISTSLLIFVPLSIVISIVGFVLSPQITLWLNVPTEVQSATIAYMQVYMVGFLFQFVYNIGSSVLTGLGNSRTPLLFLIVSSVCNMVLDYVFVVVFKMDVTGLAWATVASQVVAAVFVFFIMIKLHASFDVRADIYSKHAMRSIFRFGIPSMIHHMLMSLGQISLQNVINGYGVIVMAGYSVAFRINGLIIGSFMAIANSLTGFIAQNFGAKKPDRIKDGIRSALLISYAFCICVVIILMIWGRPILEVFVKDSDNAAAIVDAGMGFTWIITPFYLLVCLKTTYDGALRGIGAMKSFMIATFSDVVVRIICGEPFSRLWGINGVWAVWPTAWLVGTLFSVGLYYFLTRIKRTISFE